MTTSREPAQPSAAHEPIRARVRRNLDYDAGLTWQRETLERLKRDPAAPGEILFAEHRSVVTLGRSGDGSALRLSPQMLEARGVAYREVGRGGDVTWHGPGQWTVYPILRLEEFGRDLHRYMRLLEEVTIRWLAGHGVSGERVAGKTGVWIAQPQRSASAQIFLDADKTIVEPGAQGRAFCCSTGDAGAGANVMDSAPQPGARMAKLAAVGVAVSRWISHHGTAVNVQPDLSPLREYMHPCGIRADEGDVTSLAECTSLAYDMETEARRWAEAFAAVTRREVVWARG